MIKFTACLISVVMGAAQATLSEDYSSVSHYDGASP